MNLNKYILLLLLIPAIAGFSTAQEKALQSITKNDLKRHIVFLASDSLQGRALSQGNRGLETAAGYLHNNAKETGLKPFNNSYFQSFEIVASTPDCKANSRKKSRITYSVHSEDRASEEKKAQNVQRFTAQNVVGILEGSDENLKNECIVFMAHYDHLGTDKKGNIFNGADDNATGCAILIELAEAFAQLEKRPRRSIVFLWTTAEEIGMLGSQYYVNNPAFALEKTKACINIDMAGRVYEQRDSVRENSPKLVKSFDGIYTLINDVSPELDKITVSACNQLDLIPDKSLPDYFFRSSDHRHFHSREVAVLNLSTGYHADYHKVTDDVSRIRFDKVKRVANLCFLVGLEMANRY
jgi:hypothetical protein